MGAGHIVNEGGEGRGYRGQLDERREWIRYGANDGEVGGEGVEEQKMSTSEE